MENIKEMTLIIVKPDAVVRHLEDKILKMLEDTGVERIAYLKQTLSIEQCIEFYSAHAGAPYFLSLLDSMTQAPSIVSVMQGENAISKCRAICGSTNPIEAEPHTIRGMWGVSNPLNSVHSSDSKDSAIREIEMFFPTLIEKQVEITTQYVSLNPDLQNSNNQ